MELTGLGGFQRQANPLSSFANLHETLLNIYMGGVKHQTGVIASMSLWGLCTLVYEEIDVGASDTPFIRTFLKTIMECTGADKERLHAVDTAVQVVRALAPLSFRLDEVDPPLVETVMLHRMVNNGHNHIHHFRNETDNHNKMLVHGKAVTSIFYTLTDWLMVCPCKIFKKQNLMKSLFQLIIRAGGGESSFKSQETTKLEKSIQNAAEFCLTHILNYLNNFPLPDRNGSNCTGIVEDGFGADAISMVFKKKICISAAGALDPTRLYGENGGLTRLILRDPSGKFVWDFTPLSTEVAEVAPQPASPNLRGLASVGGKECKSPEATDLDLNQPLYSQTSVSKVPGAEPMARRDIDPRGPLKDVPPFVLDRQSGLDPLAQIAAYSAKCISFPSFPDMGPQKAPTMEASFLVVSDEAKRQEEEERTIGHHQNKPRLFSTDISLAGGMSFGPCFPARANAVAPLLESLGVVNVWDVIRESETAPTRRLAKGDKLERSLRLIDTNSLPGVPQDRPGVHRSWPE